MHPAIVPMSSLLKKTDSHAIQHVQDLFPVGLLFLSLHSLVFDTNCHERKLGM